MKVDSDLAPILVIDDKIGPRESVRMLFKYEYNVNCAVSVDEGLEILAESEPEIVILDINMPEKDGIEGLKEIRKIDPSVAVVMLTGYGSLQTAREAIRLGANDYITKPFDTQEMRDIVRQGVERTRLNRRRNAAGKKADDLNERLTQNLLEMKNMAELGQASADLVHDLRNPLTAILGFISLITKRLNDTQFFNCDQLTSAREYLSCMEMEISRCCELTKFWEDLDAKKKRPLTEISVNRLLDEIVTILKAENDTSSKAIEFLLDLEECTVVGDELQLHRAIHNLLGNAVQAITQADGCVAIMCRNNNDTVEIGIRDNGHGIESDRLEEIFEPYFTTKDVAEGTGLGLFIAKKIIESLEGTISAESVVGQGTTFSIRLPNKE